MEEEIYFLGSSCGNLAVEKVAVGKLAVGKLAVEKLAVRNYSL